MKIYALSDLHLSFMVEKPMDVFGGAWNNYTDKIKERWQEIIEPDDVVLVAGDISWAMKLEETKADFDYLSNLNGKKIIIKGNHEYWWKSISAVRNILPDNVLALQNDSIRLEGFVIAGTRGWDLPEFEGDPTFDENDNKIYLREQIRLELTLSDARKKMQKGDKLICMMHYPPFNMRKDESGFTKLFEKYGVDKVVYGHLHKSAATYPKVYKRNGIEYYLTSADLIDMTPVRIY